MKKIVMLIAVLLGTTLMVNAQTTPVKVVATKEVKSTHHKKEVKVQKDAAAVKVDATKKTAPVKDAGVKTIKKTEAVKTAVKK